MAVRTDNKNGVVVCQVDGEIDINTAPDVKKAFDKILSKKEPKIIVNFSKVTYVDSSGLATLVEILKNMKSYGGRLKLTNLSPKIKSLFEITKLERLFEILVDEKDAIETFA